MSVILVHEHAYIGARSNGVASLLHNLPADEAIHISGIE